MGRGKTSEDANASYTETETQRRFEQALKAGLNTPPLPREDVPSKRAMSKSAKNARKAGEEAAGELLSVKSNRQSVE